MHHGWIKLYRCLLDDPLWQCGTNEQKVILVTLLLMANHAETQWQYNGKPYTCKPGQMITSLRSIQQKCGGHISLQKIRTALQRFEQMGFLNKQTNTHNTLISICNWDVYQSSERPVNTPITQRSQTNNKRLTPNKNVKNEKNQKRYTPSAYPASFEEQDIHRAEAATAQALNTFMGNPDPVNVHF